MGIRAYQPQRKDLLINTEWGIPKEHISKDEAEERHLKLFHGRWVTKEEKKQLKGENYAYRSIRSLGYLFIFFSLLTLVFSILLTRRNCNSLWTHLLNYRLWLTEIQELGPHYSIHHPLCLYTGHPVSQS